jgi:hypothetical protein
MTLDVASSLCTRSFRQMHRAAIIARSPALRSMSISRLGRRRQGRTSRRDVHHKRLGAHERARDAVLASVNDRRDDWTVLAAELYLCVTALPVPAHDKNLRFSRGHVCVLPDERWRVSILTRSRAVTAGTHTSSSSFVKANLRRAVNSGEPCSPVACATNVVWMCISSCLSSRSGAPYASESSASVLIGWRRRTGNGKHDAYASGRSSSWPCP